MRRRLFLSSGSAAFALALTGCGGGGGGSNPAAAGASDGSAAAASPLSADGPLASTASSSTIAASSSSSSASAGGSGYPFGARIDRYVAGIAPTQGTAAMDAVLAAQYDAWKAARVVSAESVAPGGYAVQFSDRTYLTVSEGMGYGMLLAVVFAGHDPQAQSVFDGMLAVVRARPANSVVPFDANGKYLMDWRLLPSGASSGDAWSAMDGDLDIAMAMLMAHRQWGSGGKWNYLQEARNTIAALKSWHMSPEGVTKSLRAPTNNRSSDYMVGHFRAFKQATGDTLWDNAVDRAYELIDRLQTNYAPATGLVPDFVMNTNTTNPSPSTGYIGDGNANEGYYWWNACRDPWRFASDYLLSGDARFATVTGRMIDFFSRSSGGDPVNIGTGYALDGTQITGGNSPAYHGPICAGACVDARFQGFLDTMWQWNAGHLTTGYYDGEIQLLSMVVASGNWWSTARG